MQQVAGRGTLLLTVLTLGEEFTIEIEFDITVLNLPSSFKRSIVNGSSVNNISN